MRVAQEIVELFEELLDGKGIEVPCSDEIEQKDRHGGGNVAKLYGMEYWTLVERVENLLFETYGSACVSKGNTGEEAPAGEHIKKSFIVSWHASGYTGTFRYMVVADNLEDAKDMWNDFVAGNRDIEYSWRKAEKGVQNHYGGFITWKESDESNKEKGCYELPYCVWNTGSDHLWD